MAKSLTTLLLLSLTALSAVQARLFMPTYVQRMWEKQSADEPAIHARQLVHRNTWATLSTNSIDFPGTPIGSIVSYSDGIGNSAANATGEIFFYLTDMDTVAQNLEKDARATVSISLAQEGPKACDKDVMDPTCWKIAIIGRVVPVTAEDKAKFALEALFSKHPEMKYWPRDHGFFVYVLQVDAMQLLDNYGGPKHIKPEEYYRVKLSDA